MLPRQRTGFAVGLALGLLAIVATRAPQFLSGRMLLDGDESVVGVMAIQASRGQGLPLFFFGQDYGFAPLEVGMAALFFQCFGISVVAFKAAMLTLWMLGWLLWVTAVRRLANERIALVAGLLIATAPAWGVVGMKGWVTCLTAFVALGLALHALSRLREPLPWRPVSAAILGGACVILWITQVHFIVTLLPVCAVYAIPRRRWADLLTATAVFLLALTAIRSMPLPEGTIRSVPTSAIIERSFASLPTAGELLLRTAERTRGVFTGSYYFSLPIDVGWFTQAAGVAWLIAFSAALVALLLVAPLRRSRIAWACLLAALPSWALAALVPPENFQYRYLLPLTCVAAILIAACLAWAWDNGRAGRVLGIGILAGLVGVGVLSMAEFRRSSWSSMAGPTRLNEKEALENLVRGLEEEGIRHVFTKSEMLRWKLVFASRDRVVASTGAANDRYPEHARALNAALLNGSPIALVGERSWMEEFLRSAPLPALSRPRIAEFGPWIMATWPLDAAALRSLVPNAPAPPPPR